MSSKGGLTRKGAKPNESKKLPVKESGKNRPAKGFNPKTKSWDTQSHGK